MKKCTKCNSVKAITDYHKTRNWCKDCTNSYYRAYRKKNIGQVEATEKKWRDANPDIIRQNVRNQTAKNPGLKLRRDSVCRGIRNGYTERSNAYRLIQLDHESLWVLLKEKWLNKYGTPFNGDPYEVDHEIPCSIEENHHHSNLQILRPIDNRTKGADFNIIDLL